MAKYAKDTDVEISQSIKDIEWEVNKYGGGQFYFGQMPNQLAVGFSKDGRQVRFQVLLKEDDAQANRSVARALFLVIKSNLVAADSGVQSFEDAFLSNILMPDNQTIGQMVRKQIAHAYKTNEMPNLLPDYTA